MDKLSENILNIDKIICSNIDKREVLNDDGLMAQNIISQLRNFIEAIIRKVYSVEHESDLSHDTLKQALRYINMNDDFVFLKNFHKNLEITDSHLSLEPDAALRIMWKYYSYLIDCKKFLKEKFGLEVLSNIDKFPLEEDKSLKEYYKNIADKINSFNIIEITDKPTPRHKILKKKCFRVNNEKYFEITICEADNKTSKFDRIITFTKIDIPTFYSTCFKFADSHINIIGKDMPIKIIVGYKVSIRPCEFNHYFAFLGYITKIQTPNKDYEYLMTYLTKTKRNLIDFLEYDEEDYLAVKNKICKNLNLSPIFDGITKCREMFNKPGYNILKYLLFRLDNKVLNAQYNVFENQNLSQMHFDYKCIPFDTMPFVNNPVKYNASLTDLYDSISIAGHEHELLARKIKINTEINAKLYTPIEELSKFNDIEGLINSYNQALYYKHQEDSSLKLENGQVYISGYENHTINIINYLKQLSSEGVLGYKESVNDWMKKSEYYIDDEKKREALPKLFDYSKVVLIYGSAGTGKSTMIKHISNFFRDKNKLYLANTNAAVQNLKHNIGNIGDVEYYTIKSFLYGNYIKNYDIVFIDECSTLSNQDMSDFLDKTSFSLLVLVGDIYQIESIKFGNWFYIAKEYISKKSILELNCIHRSAENELLSLWKSVRNLDKNMQDIIELNHFSHEMDDSIFNKMSEDEIILCLNYDGLYGINNINKFLQDDNQGKSVEIELEKYKVGDPIIFIDNKRFSNYLYNNLKGKIVDIIENNNIINFTVEIDMVLNGIDVEGAPFMLEAPINKNKSVISFEINRLIKKDDEDKDDDNVVPFKVAYAVSIHKAQGLEYDSVKIIITDEVDELITHNIFYTAITRAKKSLRIYWSNQSEKKILNGMRLMFNNRDASILLEKNKI